MSSFLRHIKYCTAHNPDRFTPFVIGNTVVGSVSTSNVSLILQEPSFRLEDGKLILQPQDDTPKGRTEALKNISKRMSVQLDVPLVGEIYPIINMWDDEPWAEIDRAAIPWFGTKGFGVHVNGYVRKKDGIHIWVAQRAHDRRIDPGKLDNLVGGGLPLGYTVEENLLKEAWEEAGIVKEIADTAFAHGMLSYKRDMMLGVRNDSLFIFDLELPEDFEPRNTDGEVQRFDLVPADEVAGIVCVTDRFKFNCNLVLIDFFLRHNIIDPEHSEYDALTKAMKTIRS